LRGCALWFLVTKTHCTTPVNNENEEVHEEEWNATLISSRSYTI
jgi:hypothetical protein